MKKTTRQSYLIFSSFLLATVLSASVYFALTTGIQRSFHHMEDLTVNQTVERLNNGLQGYSGFLVQKSGDWARWDASYDFISQYDENYVRENITEDTLTTLDINMMIYLNPKGEVVYKQNIDSQTLDFKEIPEGILETLPKIRDLLNEKKDFEPATGFLVTTDNAPLFFAAQHILKTDLSGPPNGILIMAKYLDQSVIDNLARITIFPLTLEKTSSDILPKDFKEAANTLLESQQLYFLKKDEKNIYAYTLIRDAWNQPAFIFRTDLSGFQSEFNSAHRYIFWICVGNGLVVGILIYFFRRRGKSRS